MAAFIVQRHDPSYQIVEHVGAAVGNRGVQWQEARPRACEAGVTQVERASNALVAEEECYGSSQAKRRTVAQQGVAVKPHRHTVEEGAPGLRCGEAHTTLIAMMTVPTCV